MSEPNRDVDASPAMAADQTDERLPWRRLLLIAGAALVLFFLGSLAAVWIQLDETGSLDDRSGTGARVGQPLVGIVEQRQVELEDRAQRDLEQKRRRLHGYGWVDRQQRIIHIPIELGMQRVAEGKR
jgi:hypothetical protein